MNGIDNIGARIKYLRDQEGLSQAAFAKRIGVSSGNVGDWESTIKKSMPGAKAIHAISCEFNVTADWVLNGENISNNNGFVLTPDEMELLHLFRKLSFKDQMKTIGYVESAVEKHSQKEQSSNLISGEEAATDETA